ncbi:MAG: hypothetical protein J6I66_08735 [Lachnospiraceae bacterium]|nr:hypothetical protein [Lachnospiraceae bacterium]
MNKFKRVRVFGVLFFGLIPVLSTSLYGCTRSDEESEPVLLVTEETEEDVAGNLPVEYTDVVSTISVGVKYRTAATQDLSFDVERAKIDSVLVTPGETVRAGQLLITLETDTDIEAEREDLLYQIERINLLILQVQHQIEYEKTVARFDAAMDTPITDEKKEKLEEKLQAIDDKYYFTLQDYEDQITICNLKLYNLENNNNDHNIYAGMDGIVEYVREGLQGSQTVIGRTVITIKDPGDMYFYATDSSAVQYLEGMESVTINVNGASVAEYEAIPELTDDGKGLRFILTGDSASAIIAENTTGSIIVELGKKENVLSVPKAAVHRAGDKVYVYVVDEDGYRRYREVQTGLEGDTRIEIISGLEAGEIVAVNY